MIEMFFGLLIGTMLSLVLFVTKKALKKL